MITDVFVFIKWSSSQLYIKEVCILPYLLILGFVALTFFAIRKQMLNEILPSMGWTAFMVVPFVFLSPTFHPNFLFPQTMGLMCFGLLLLLGDAFVVYKTRLASQAEDLSFALLYRNRILKSAILLFCLILCIQVLHYTLMPKIPLFEKLFHGPHTDVELRWLRENAVKLLKVPTLLKYFFQFTIIVFTPVTFGLFLWLKKPFWACAIFINTALYTLSTLTKGPILTLTGLCAIVYISHFSVQKQFQFFKTLYIGLFILLTSLFAFLLLKSPSALNYQSTQPDPFIDPFPSNEIQSKGEFYKPQYTFVDNYRALRDDPVYLTFPSIEKNLNLYFFRAFEVPVEAAHRWYHFYPYVFGRHLGFYGLTSSSRSSPDFRHPANWIAFWGYRARHPSQYETSAHAYASIDADAWARWGYPGLIIIGLLIFAFRIILFYLRPSHYPADAYNAALFLLATALPAASIQALFVAQGFLAYVCILAMTALTLRIKGPAHVVKKEISAN